jgi:CRISPR/Cas system-associated endonuclease Cas1
VQARESAAHPIVSQGLDPTLGYPHACAGQGVALLTDLMERLRPQVDRPVLVFVPSRTFILSAF